MSDAPPVVKLSDKKRRRRRSVYRPPQDYASVAEYHEACVVKREPPLQTTANRGYASIKDKYR